MIDTFIGIDGGGTRTVAVVIDRSGAELGRVEGGPSLVRRGDPTAGVSLLANLAERALTTAGKAPPARAICFALAGAGREADRIEIAAALQREALTERIRVVTDADAALYDAFENGPGILLIAGTGSIALAQSEREGTTRVGGWGALLGDEGSGYAIGLSALQAAIRAYDLRGPETRLLHALLDELELEGAPDLVDWTARAGKDEIAALSRLVSELANSGDQVADQILTLAVEALIEHIESALCNGSPWSEPPALGLSGGLLEPDGLLRERLLERLYETRAAQPRDGTGGPVVIIRGEKYRSMYILSRLPLRDEPIDAARGAAKIALGG